MDFNKEKINIAVIGLGYVGLPLFVELSRKFKTIGYDLDDSRIVELLNFFDRTNEVDQEVLKKLQEESILSLSNKSECLHDANLYIITVPTPVDSNNVPNLNPLKNAVQDVAQYLKIGDIVVLESTVYPGVTEDICSKILEQISGLEFNKDFFMGYSPERINPGDKEHHLTKVIKIVSGSSEGSLEKISKVYGEIIEAGIYEAESIQVAEAAKVIENAQRDVNIAFMN